MDTIFSRLRMWRFQLARELSVPSFFILSNAHLAGVALAQPATLEELAQCPGIGPKKLLQFGPDLLQQVARCMVEGLEPGVVPPPEAAAAQTERDLSEADLAEIAAGLRRELAGKLARRFKGRYTQAQVEEALRRLSLPA
jgi:ribonuclease D